MLNATPLVAGSDHPVHKLFVELQEFVDARKLDHSVALSALASLYRYQLLQHPCCYESHLQMLGHIGGEVRHRMTGSGGGDRDAALQVLGTHIVSLLKQLHVHPVVAVDAAMNLVVFSLQEAPELTSLAISALKEMASNLEAGGAPKAFAAATAAVSRH